MLKRVFLLLIFSGLAAAQSDIEGQLQKEFLNSSRLLRNFYADDYLHYGSTGNLTGKSAAGPWTIYGYIIVDAVRLQSDKLQIEGHRQVMVFSPEKKKLV